MRYLPDMKRSLIWIVPLASAAYFACSLSTSATPTSAIPPAVPTATAAAFYPDFTRTGIPPVDAVIAAVSNGDLDALNRTVELRPERCTKNFIGPGDPIPCTVDEAAGATIGVFQEERCEGASIRRDGIEAILRQTLSPGRQLYAVYRSDVPAMSGYDIVFAEGDPKRKVGVTFRVDTGLWAISFGCGAGAAPGFGVAAARPIHADDPLPPKESGS